MAKIYYCSNCQMVQVSQPGMLCENCASLFGGNSEGFPGNQFHPGNSYPRTADNPNSFPFANSGSPSAFPNTDDNHTAIPFPDTGRESVFPTGYASGTPSFGWDSGKTGQGAEAAQMNPVQVAHNTFRGEINSIHSQPTYKRPRFLQRWLNSLFRGAPFTMEPMLVNLQLSVDGKQAAHMGGIATSRNVQLYAGQNESSMFTPGNRVTVYGRQDMRGVILAQRIYNETTCSQLSFGISTWLVRLITLLLIGVLYLLIRSYDGTWGNFQLPQVSQDNLATMCAVMLVALIVVFSVRRNQRVRSIVAWGSAIVITALIAPELCAIVIMLLGLKFLFMGF